MTSTPMPPSEFPGTVEGSGEDDQAQGGADTARLLVVGIGASAGGLHPLQAFFDAVEPHPNMALVIVQHLSPDFKSLMGELLARHTSMQVKTAEDDMEIQGGVVYLMPPDRTLRVQGERLKLVKRQHSPDVAQVHHPIDTFFESLGASFGPRSAGVVLSGTGTDGTKGIRAIVDAGGLAIVQDPDTAQFDGMPRSAIASGQVHFVLSPEEIGRMVSGKAAGRTAGLDEQIIPPLLVDTSIIPRITGVLTEEEGVDFSHYKTSTLARRITRRMQALSIEDPESFIEYLMQSQEERRRLRSDLLINVTGFFRDPDAWATLERDVLPLIADGVDNDPPQLRAWVTACSTGEEVYTLAMLLTELRERYDRRFALKIFASDLDRVALARAAEGVYGSEIVADISPDRLERFFVRRGDQFQVSRQLRETIIFTPHNLISDAPFTKLDLVTCRNVLIYMQPHLQRRVTALLHFALKAKGYLMLGAAETLGELSSEFQTASRHWKMYRKRREVVVPLIREVVAPNTGAASLPTVRNLARPTTGQIVSTVEQGLRTILRSRSALALVVSDAGDLLHVFGASDSWLKVPEGEATRDLGKLLPSDLAVAIKTAIHRVERERQTVTYPPMRVQQAGHDQVVRVTVASMSQSQSVADGMVVIVEPVTHEMAVTEADGDIEADTSQRVRDLERELDGTRQSLQATIEELETANEEQHASNEELLASNEELQSTNEELHSVNEELHTVNAEYQAKIQELTDLHADIDNLLRSTDIGTIFLDSDLRIRKYTPAACDVVNLMEQDLGRPIDHFANRLDGADMTELAREVLRDSHPKIREVQLPDSERMLMMRVHPYRVDDGLTDGVVITFVDVTQLKQTQRDLEAANVELQLSRNIIQSTSEGVIATDLDGRITHWNQGAARLYGFTSDEMVGRPIGEFCAECEELLERVRRGEAVEGFECTRPTRDGRRVPVSITLSPLLDRSERVIGACTFVHDISRQRKAEIGQRDAMNVLSSVLDAAMHGIMALKAVRDANGNVIDFELTHINAAGAATFDLPPEQLIGAKLLEVQPDVRTVGLFDQYREVIKTGQPLRRELYYDHQGISGWFDLGATKLGDGVTVSFIDVTEARATRQELAEVNRRLTQANHELEQFVYTASHDLKSPLVTMLGFTGRIREDVEAGRTDRVAEFIDHLESAAQDMRSNVDDLLELSRIGRVAHEPELVDPKPVIDQILEDFQPQIERDRVRVELTDDLPIILVDEARLRQSFSNLIDNALRYGASEKPCIRIGADTVDGEVRFYVRDNGPGIPERMHERIFGLFQRGSSSGEGTGIGLAIVKRVAEAHGGRAWVESSLGAGATFWFALPKADNDSPAER